MSDRSTIAPRRSRRRLAIWLGFAVLGISMGAVWATGFATFSGGGNTPGPPADSPVVTPGSPLNAVNPPLTGLVTAGAPWTVAWTGDWGSTPKAWFFEIDLSGQPVTANYNIAMLLTNGHDMSGAQHPWQELQLKTVLQSTVDPTKCDAADFTGGDSNAHLFSFASEDAGVYWNSVAGGKVWCIGIEAATPPYNGSGTFLRSTDGTPPDVYPTFVATVNRVS
jgi:hypothetical protein